MLRRFSNLNLITKLLIPLLFLVITTGAILWTAQRGFEDLRSQTEIIMQNTVARRVLFLKAVGDVDDAAIQEKTIVGTGDDAMIKPSHDRYIARFAEALAAGDQLVALSPTPERRAINQEFRQMMVDYKAVADRSIALRVTGQRDDATRLSYGDVVAARRKVANFSEERETILGAEMTKEQADLATLGQSVLMRLYIFAAVGFTIALGLLAATVLFLIVRPLSVVTASLQRLAEGDLGTDVAGADRKDEVGRLARSLLVFKANGLKAVALEAEAAAMRADAEAERIRIEAERAREAAEDQFAITVLAQGLDALAQGNLTHQIHEKVAPKTQKLKDDFNATALRLRNTMATITTAIQSMANGTDEISSAADDLSRRTEQQAASLEQTAAALDEITVTVRKTADGAGHAKDIVSAAKNDAERSSAVVRDTVTAMGEIARSSQQVSQIIGVIDEIAFQTNLLALNAGVEAARAGDAGRGFAVVASEVRALAQRSAEAAKEIKQLIVTSSRQVDGGVHLVDETGKSLQRIVTQVAEAYSAIDVIALSAKEQAGGLHEVNNAINQMDQVTQQNAAMVEQSTAASHSLAQETAALKRLTEFFKIGEQPGGRNLRRLALATTG